ncbi:hypothetical protein JQX26_23395 [Marivita cryptomonadis]|uniref:Uncharacterized protein n=2 Tax=Marivita cryptomonadis TaxID=505252 RepID=A0A9Q2P0I7_9RHOB|nr:hypothetical protein [Marivita sp. LZ-15-2]MBM2324298.1 hypothetical protein [Marivita cryptomonadis]MBM2333881.1 hypothetical protein [Marivita cryptomonadis]MBM2343455.1 hypothetical protein [Marivita cryptomonadis]MBM2348138.1 hypothetical protein [Marivita cryptomonadis]MBM2352817.1 hypothetical protein [Marivita cryptomonadis]
MRSFLVSTFKRLLKVTLSSDGDILERRVLREGQGVYFGLAQAGRRVFVVERNLDINKRPMTLGAPENVIRAYVKSPRGGMIRTPVCYGSSAFDDLHQITYDQQNLFVTSARHPFLLKRSIWGKSIQGLDLEAVVPAHLQRPDAKRKDTYHFNSVSVDKESLLVLSHNWDRPSFALRLSLPAARRGKAVRTAWYEGIGTCCHDILAAGGAIWSLDSGGSALVRIDPANGALKRFVLKSQAGDPFPRGLGRWDNMLLVSYGFNSDDRAARMESGSMLALFDLTQQRFTKHLDLGAHGNTCAILAL